MFNEPMSDEPMSDEPMSDNATPKIRRPLRETTAYMVWELINQYKTNWHIAYAMTERLTVEDDSEAEQFIELINHVCEQDDAWQSRVALYYIITNEGGNVTPGFLAGCLEEAALDIHRGSTKDYVEDHFDDIFPGISEEVAPYIDTESYAHNMIEGGDAHEFEFDGDRYTFTGEY